MATTALRALLQSNDGAHLGPLRGVTGGSLAYSVASTIKSSGSIRLTSTNQNHDWLNVRIKLIAVINNEEHPLGVFIPSMPQTEYGSNGVAWEIQLLDKLTVLDQDAVDGPYQLAAGANVIDEVVTLIQGAGEQAGAITPDTATLRGAAIWPAGTTRLRIINDLLESAGYFSLWCDGDGQYQATPYTEPARRPVAADFIDGKNGVGYLPDFSRSQDLWRIPNRVVVTSRSSGEEAALVGTATNTNPDSPYSTTSRGRIITHVEEDVELANQAAADAYAQRRLQELSSATATIEVSHPYTPLLLNDAVTFTREKVWGSYRLNRVKHVVQRMEVDLSSVAFLTRSTLREVVDV